MNMKNRRKKNWKKEYTVHVLNLKKMSSMQMKPYTIIVFVKQQNKILQRKIQKEI